VISIVVTGAAGAVGQRTVRQLAADSSVDRVVALDRVPFPGSNPKIESHKVDLLVEDLGPLMVGGDVVIHLAEDPSRVGDAGLAEHMLNRVLDGADAADCRRLVVLSSATVYGAHPDNPVPLTESHALRPIEGLAFAMAKQRLEQKAESWEQETGKSLAILRPTTTLSERGASWVAKALRAATMVRSDQVDPPVQFLHHDDLASALSLVARRGLTGTFNVAPDGWIGSEVFRGLVGGPQVRIPQALSDRVLRAGRTYGVGRTPEGIEPYTRHSWVVANDRLRSEGWVPAFSNEEAFVLGTPAPIWAVSAQRRQELALAAAGIGVAGAMAALAGVTRRLMR